MKARRAAPGPRAAAALLVAIFTTLGCPMAAAQGGPPLSVPEDQLDAALRCPHGLQHLDREPVLLVHGTSVDSDESWDWNYLRALPRAGIDACVVDLPDRALGDIQHSAEFVVHAVRRIHTRTGRRVDVVGHSQGPLEPRWAIKWWPDVRAAVDDLVGISAPNHGATTIDLLCSLRRCLPAALQMRTRARFLAALNRVDETPGRVNHTSVISRSDGLVVPPSTSRLTGASNVVVQELCPGRLVDHYRMLADAATFAIVLDALAHAGGADLRRVDGQACRRDLMPTVTYRDLLLRAVEAAKDALPYALTYPMVSREPELRPYAVE